MRILTYTVTPEEDGRMVKGILRGSLQLSYTLLKSLKWRENAILLNGQSVHVNAIVHAGDVVSVALSERTPREDLYCANATKPDIVYEDDDPEKLAERLAWAIDHPEKLAAMRQACRDLYERHYSKQAFADGLKQAVRELTGESTLSLCQN